MKKAIIVEDELASVNVLMNNIHLYAQNNIQVVGVADSVTDTLKLIKQYKIDIAFMDVVLRDGTSFEILDQLNEIDFKIVFITAYDKFAVEAFRFSAIDYLLKPLDDKLFRELVDKINIEHTPTKNQQNQYDFLNSIRKTNIIERVNKIALPTDTEIIFESLDNILFLQAQQNYTHIQTNDGKKYIMSKNLGYYEEILAAHSNFFRVHHSTIINISYIQRVTKSNASTSFVIHFSNDLTFNISQRRLAEFKKLIDL